MKSIFILFMLIYSVAFATAQEKKSIPGSDKLYNEIVLQDSLFFHAYNNCDIKTQTNYYSDSIEFYHDKGGLSTSKKDLLAATQKNICGKVTRELIKGSIEVSPVPGYGAIEIGMHRFHNNQEPESNQKQTGSRFIIIWHYIKGEWKITRVISLH